MDGTSPKALLARPFFAGLNRYLSASSTSIEDLMSFREEDILAAMDLEQDKFAMKLFLATVKKSTSQPCDVSECEVAGDESGIGSATTSPTCRLSPFVEPFVPSVMKEAQQVHDTSSSEVLRFDFDAMPLDPTQVLFPETSIGRLVISSRSGRCNMLAGENLFYLLSMLRYKELRVGVLDLEGNQNAFLSSVNMASAKILILTKEQQYLLDLLQVADRILLRPAPHIQTQFERAMATIIACVAADDPSPNHEKVFTILRRIDCFCFPNHLSTIEEKAAHFKSSFRWPAFMLKNWTQQNWITAVESIAVAHVR
jgi:hypothetical protein